MSATAAPTLRAIPESVTLSGEQYIELLARLDAIEDVFAVLNGNYTPTPAEDVILAGAIRILDDLAGQIGSEDEQYELDPVNIASRARGSELAEELLGAMANKIGHGLDGVLPETYAPRELRDYLYSAALKCGDRAATIREQGTL